MFAFCEFIQMLCRHISSRNVFRTRFFLRKGGKISPFRAVEKKRRGSFIFLFLNDTEASLMPWRLARIEINIFRMSTWRLLRDASKRIKIKILSNFFNYASFFMRCFLIKFLWRYVPGELGNFVFSPKHKMVAH